MHRMRRKKKRKKNIDKKSLKSITQNAHAIYIILSFFRTLEPEAIAVTNTFLNTVLITFTSKCLLDNLCGGNFIYPFEKMK